MDYSTWKVGDKIVCIGKTGDRSHPKLAGVSWPQVGEVYTIRKLDYLVCSYGEGVVLWLDEIHNPTVKFCDLPAMECGFAARCFRPVQHRKTDISIFTRMLTGPKSTVNA